MILTVTMNPSIDIAYQIPRFAMDHVNRAEETVKTAGGKGLNVTRVLSALGEDVRAVGLTGGKNGEYLKEKLAEAGIEEAFYPVSGDTRNCIAILHEGKQTEILEAGPFISTDEYRGFLKHFCYLLSSCSAIVLSGSLPPGILQNFYAKLTAAAAAAGVPAVLDCSGEALRHAVTADIKPTAIKPNTDELAVLLNREVPKDPVKLKEILSSPLFRGIEWIVVSLGAGGCFARHHDHFYHVQIPKIDVISPVGSGDAMVAGIASGIVSHLSDEELLRRANTLGMLNAMEKGTGCVNMNNYDRLYQQITVTKV